MSNNLRSIIICPTFGNPYLVKTINKKNTDENLKLLQKCVQGSIDRLDKKSFIFHPLFTKESPRWALAERILKDPNTRVWVSEEGLEKCCPNMATVLLPHLRYGGCPHLMGDIVLDCPHNIFKKLNINYLCLKLADKCIDSDGCFEPYEPDDEDDIVEMNKTCQKNGWEYKEDTGQIYLSVCS